MVVTKENLYNEIQKNIYANNFEDLKVFSKQYFHSVVLPCYENNSIKNNYSIISIDFNDMAKINSKGMAHGDEILHNSVDYMQSVMPEGTYCIRMGGDEFLFFLNNTSREQALQYEEMMHEKLKEHSEDLDDTTVTSYCVNSENTQSLADMVEVADAGINNLKQTAKANKTKNVSEMDVFKYKLKENFSTFFKTLRLHNFPSVQKLIIDVTRGTVNTYEHFCTTKNETEPEQDVNFKEAKSLKKDLGDLEQLNSMFVSHRYVPPTVEELESLDSERFNNLLDSLVRDPLTNQFNKNYFVNYLLANPNNNFKALRLSSAFVKISNTLNSSHSVTDIQIQDSINGLTDFLSQKVEINTESFAKESSNHIIALDGGDLIVLLDQNANVSAKEIHAYLDEMNSKEYSKDSILRLVAADNFKNITSKNFVQVMAKQSDECNKNKNPLIEKFLHTGLTSNLLDITLQDNLNFYRNVVKDSSSFEAKRDYFQNLLDVFKELYPTLDIDRTEKTDRTFNSLMKKLQSLLDMLLPPFGKKPPALPAPPNENTVEEASTKKLSDEDAPPQKLPDEKSSTTRFLDEYKVSPEQLNIPKESTGTPDVGQSTTTKAQREQDDSSQK